MHKPHIAGFATSAFSNVEKVFRKNFDDGWEREGAAITVYYKGELVADFYGGYSDASTLRQWTPKTRTVVFSVSKAVGAMCIALLVDRGYLKYSDLVCNYWPEFAQNGKQDITVDWIMSHRAGLAALDQSIDFKDASDHQKISQIIAQQKPNWTPGTKSGYHAITYGWLVDQLIRRVDPKHRSIGQFFKQEIADVHDIDFFIGLPPEEEHTMSRLTSPTLAYKVREVLYDPRVLYIFCALNFRSSKSISGKIRNTATWLKIEGNVNTFNNPEVHCIEQVAALGITKASDLARLFALFASGKIVSKQLIEKFKKPVVTSGLDLIVLAPFPKGHGFMYERHPYKPGKWLVGHAGYGGSTMMMDLEDDLVIAYVSNGLKGGTGELTRTYRLLRNAALQCIR